MFTLEHYYCRKHRDERARELRRCGYKVTVRSSRGSVFSPGSLDDPQCYPYTPSPNGFGGYADTYMAHLYTLEARY